MKRNPDWLDASRFAPQYWHYPVTHFPDKPVCMQCSVSAATAQHLVSAGITHLWEAVAVSSSRFDGIKRCQNYSTHLFDKQDPTEDEVRRVASSIHLYDEFVVTDEFGEGAFPQVDQTQTSIWFYDELQKKANRENKRVHLFGEYGSQAVQCYTDFRHDHLTPRNPVDPYFLDLLTPDITSVIDQSARYFKKYLTTDLVNVRGRCLCYYYAYEVLDGDWVTSIPFNAMLNYNAADTECLLFCWGKSQSNGAMVDVPQKDSGSIHPNGDITFDYPIVNPETMKILGFFGMLFCDAVYLWDDYGLVSDDENNLSWLSPKIGTDAFVIGTQWYSELIPCLTQAGREIICCDYTANGQRFSYQGKERRVSRRGTKYFFNSYFNEVAARSKGMAFLIPGDAPSFIYINAYLGIWQSEEITIHFDGKDYPLGCIPGSVLYVS